MNTRNDPKSQFARLPSGEKVVIASREGDTALVRRMDDLDRDGLLDIAVARSDAPNAVYFGSPGSARTP